MPHSSVFNECVDDTKLPTLARVAAIVSVDRRKVGFISDIGLTLAWKFREHL